MYIYTHTRTLKPRSILRVERVLQGSKIARERVKLEISRFNEFTKKKKKKKWIGVVRRFLRFLYNERIFLNLAQE